jgi:hypothetical protein
VREKKRKYAQTFAAEYLRHAVLLMQEAFLVDFIEEAALAIPRRESLQIYLAVLFGAQVTHLDDYEGVLPRWPRSE